jgi:hypothetical protein
MDKSARETVLWEVESVLEAELPGPSAVVDAITTAVHRELADSLSPLFDVNTLAETIMVKVLDLLDYDAALDLLQEAYEDPTIGHTTQSNIRTFLREHGIELRGIE